MVVGVVVVGVVEAAAVVAVVEAAVVAVVVVMVVAVRDKCATCLLVTHRLHAARLRASLSSTHA